MSSDSKEIESKFCINEYDYNHILKIGNIKFEENFLNIYFDFEQKLFNKSVSCRIRYFNDKPMIFTYKYPVEISDAYRHSTEFEIDLSLSRFFKIPKIIKPKEFLPSEISNFFYESNIDHLDRVGWIRVKRIHINLEGFNDLEVDKVWFSENDIYREIEYEDENLEAQQNVHDYFENTFKSSVPTSTSKFERFYKKLIVD